MTRGSYLNILLLVVVSGNMGQLPRRVGALRQIALRFVALAVDQTVKLTVG
jgi:hypothetical protein